MLAYNRAHVNRTPQAVVIHSTARIVGAKDSGLSRFASFPGICTAGIRHKSMVEAILSQLQNVSVDFTQRSLREEGGKSPAEVDCRMPSQIIDTSNTAVRETGHRDKAFNKSILVTGAE